MYMRSGSRPSPEGTKGCCLLVVRFLWCVQLMDNRKRTTKGQTEDEPGWGQRQRPEKNKSRPHRGGGFSLKFSCVCLVFRGDSVWYRIIYRDISWYNIPYHAISQDTRYRDIVSTSRICGLISIYHVLPNISRCQTRIIGTKRKGKILLAHRSHQFSVYSSIYVAIMLQQYLLKTQDTAPHHTTPHHTTPHHTTPHHTPLDEFQISKPVSSTTGTE